MPHPKLIERALQKSFEAHVDLARIHAEHAFFATVKPWLVKHGYSFTTGMETYAVFNKKGDLLVDDSLPKFIREILDLEIPGLPANSLGTLMPDFEPEEEK